MKEIVLPFTRFNGTNYIYQNRDLFGVTILSYMDGTTLDSAANATGTVMINRILNYWGDANNQQVILFGNSIAYDCFSNYDENRNWRYQGTSETSASERITIEDIDEDNVCIWLKWSTSNKNGGGVVTIPTTVIVETSQ